MHELAVCQEIMTQVAAVARRYGACRVTAVKVKLGPLSGVEPQLLAQAFPIASVGTPAEAAELQMEILPLKVRCRSCGALSEVQPNRLLCAACGDWRTQVVSGDEMVLAGVELVTDSESPSIDKEDCAYV